MAVQKNKVSKSRRNNRRSHDSLISLYAKECENCGEIKRSHHICNSCGQYGTRQVFGKIATVIPNEDTA